MMIKHRHTLLVFLFVFACLGVLAISFYGDWGGEEFQSRFRNAESEEAKKFQESYFRRVEYYVLKKSQPELSLIADDLTISQNDQRMSFIRPRGSLFTGDDQVMDYKGDLGVFKQGEKHLHLQGHASLSSEDSKIEADNLDYDLESGQVAAIGRVKSHRIHQLDGDRVELRGGKAFFWLQEKKAQYLGGVSGFIKRKRSYEEGLEFKSNKINFDWVEGKALAKGEIWLKKQGLIAEGRWGEIYLGSPGKKLKYFVIYDDVRVSEKVKLRNRSFERRAFCEKLEGFMGENKVILTGYPKVFQLNDVVRGNQIVLRENNEVVEVDDANTSFKIGK